MQSSPIISGEDFFLGETSVKRYGRNDGFFSLTYMQFIIHDIDLESEHENKIKLCNAGSDYRIEFMESLRSAKL